MVRFIESITPSVSILSSPNKAAGNCFYVPFILKKYASDLFNFSISRLWAWEIIRNKRVSRPHNVLLYESTIIDFTLRQFSGREDSLFPYVVPIEQANDVYDLTTMKIYQIDESWIVNGMLLPDEQENFENALIKAINEFRESILEVNNVS